MTKETAIMFAKEVDINNVYCILAVAICVISVLAKYVDPFFTTGMELLFMEGKEKAKKDRATLGVFFIIFSVANIVFLFDASLYAMECFLFIMFFSLWGLFKVMDMLNIFRHVFEGNGELGRKYVMIRTYLEVAGIMLFSPVLIISVSSYVNVNKYSLALLAAVAETFLLVLFNDGFVPKEAKISIIKKDSSETLYVYRKVNDDYLLCGNSKKMKNADSIKPIPISKIYDEEYYLRVNGENTYKCNANNENDKMERKGNIMNRTISNPNKVNHKFYIIITFVFLVFLAISVTHPEMQSFFGWNISDIIKNLSYGCVASTLIAWMIECANVRNLNKKTSAIYDTVYGDLKYQIKDFVELWSRLCKAGFKDIDYSNQKKTWMEWYIETKENFYKADKDRQQKLMGFFCNELKNAAKEVRESIDFLNSQKYLLAINEVTNSEIEGIISDFNFEFSALDIEVNNPKSVEKFWKSMDAIANDMENYIGNWSDIRFYNYVSFKPYKFWNGKEELIKAILRAKK